MELVKAYKVVTCPETGRKEKVFYRHITQTKLIEIYGCDSCHGSSTCRNCLAKIREELTPE